MRYRLIRWGLALLGIGAIVGTLALIGQNPVGWAVNNWNDLVGKTTQVRTWTPIPNRSRAAAPASTTAGGRPQQPEQFRPGEQRSQAAGRHRAERAGQPVRHRLDGHLVAGPQPAAVLRPACDSPPLAGASVDPDRAAGFGDGEEDLGRSRAAEGDSRRMLQWRPKTMQLAFSNGPCQQIVLEDEPGLQEKDLDAVDTSQIMLSIVDAYPPATDQPDDEISVTELRLFERGLRPDLWISRGWIPALGAQGRRAGDHRPALAGPRRPGGVRAPGLRLGQGAERSDVDQNVSTGVLPGISLQLRIVLGAQDRCRDPGRDLLLAEEFGATLGLGVGGGDSRRTRRSPGTG